VAADEGSYSWNQKTVQLRAHHGAVKLFLAGAMAGYILIRKLLTLKEIADQIVDGLDLEIDPRGILHTPKAVSMHTPSGNRLLLSRARSFGVRAVGVVLTGMGDDGALGLLAIRKAGGSTLVQDEATSVVIADTGDDEDNLVICLVTKKKFPRPRTIARINNPKNEVTFQLLGIDETVSSTKLIYSLIEQEVEVADVIPLTALRRGHLELVEVALTNQSPVVNKRVRDLTLPHDCTLAILVRGEAAEIIHGDTSLRGGDIIENAERGESAEEKTDS